MTMRQVDCTTELLKVRLETPFARCFLLKAWYNKEELQGGSKNFKSLLICRIWPEGW